MTNYNTELKCKDCKHASGSFIARLLRESAFFRCTIPSSYNDPVYDPVFGKETPGYFSYCSTMRGEYNTSCGPQGKSWTPRNSKYIFLAIKHS